MLDVPGGSVSQVATKRGLAHVSSVVQSENMHYLCEILKKGDKCYCSFRILSDHPKTKLIIPLASTYNKVASGDFPVVRILLPLFQSIAP